jgi:diguanylate cyclase (GGDEF)-like protein
MVAGVCLIWIDRYLHPVPTPGSLMFFPVLLAAYIGGAIPGLISAALCLVISGILLSELGHVLLLSSENFTRWIILAVVAPSTALAIGAAQSRARREQERIIATNRELEVVHAALDQVDYAVMLLDRDLRVQFMNHAAVRNGALRGRPPSEKPSSAELLREFATNGAIPVPADKVDRFVAGSLAIVRAGNSAPVDMRLTDGRIFRFRCNVLPDGGRMLTYANVTDLVRNAEKLQLMAVTDGLTGLYNHSQFIRLAKSEWNRFLRHERKLSLLVLDIDFFKSFNDQFGHEVGDQVLVHIGILCSEDRRDTDIVGRIGGEEFALLLPETGIEEAANVAERLRQKLRENPFRQDGKDLAVTVSVGIAEAQSGMSDFSDLFRCADQALYQAKNSGRNRVVGIADRLLATVSDEVVPLQSAE